MHFKERKGKDLGRPLYKGVLPSKIADTFNNYNSPTSCYLEILSGHFLEEELIGQISQNATSKC